MSPDGMIINLEIIDLKFGGKLRATQTFIKSKPL